MNPDQLRETLQNGLRNKLASGSGFGKMACTCCRTHLVVLYSMPRVTSKRHSDGSNTPRRGSRSKRTCTRRDRQSNRQQTPCSLALSRQTWLGHSRIESDTKPGKYLDSKGAVSSAG